MEVEINGKPTDVEDHEREHDEKQQASLLHKTQQSLDLKDFHTEVRGMMDVSSLLETCHFLLDVKVCIAKSKYIYQSVLIHNDCELGCPRKRAGKIKFGGDCWHNVGKDDGF